jgi:hypothetical protein
VAVVDVIDDPLNIVTVDEERPFEDADVMSRSVATGIKGVTFRLREGYTSFPNLLGNISLLKTHFAVK